MYYACARAHLQSMVGNTLSGDLINGEHPYAVSSTRRGAGVCVEVRGRTVEVRGRQAGTIAFIRRRGGGDDPSYRHAVAYRHSSCGSRSRPFHGERTTLSCQQLQSGRDGGRDGRRASVELEAGVGAGRHHYECIETRMRDVLDEGYDPAIGCSGQVGVPAA